MVRRRASAVSNHVARVVPFILRDARFALLRMRFGNRAPTKKSAAPEGRRSLLPPIVSIGLLRLARRALVLEDRAEQFPALAVELHHLQLLVDAVIVRRGVGDDAGQRQIELDVLEAGR